MSIERAAATQAIKQVRDLAAEARARSPSWPAGEPGGEGEAISSFVDRACVATGIDRASFDAALGADPALRELLRHALDEVLAEPGDPGPYAAISRESPAGNPSNYHLLEWNGITPRGGVGGSGPADQREVNAREPRRSR